MKTKVLVTGANGQLAQTIKVLYSANKENVQFVFVNKNELDITNYKEVSNFFSINNYDYCINCAAYTNVEQAEEFIELVFKINAEAVKNLALLCKKHRTVLIHISTDYVFDGKEETPYLETDLTNPINQYGKSKLKGEQCISNSLKEHFIIRTSWLYSNYGKNFVKTIANKIKENSELKITIAETGTPTSCIDLSSFLYYLITTKSNKYGIYHFSNEGITTWYGFAVEIAKHFNSFDLKKIVPVEGFITKARRPKYSVMSKDKILLNFKLSPNNWKDALSRVLETF
ncbi:dTDP-4-dehydrorhamnose reductase [Lacinutrix sp. Bg11-31]|uniref:dTDP-4-dehydrorhamnose reductase n=1 Tax=Lacinutrix sp. Bg11-31 TaxID=2057808 RepID=UPI000C31431A|nr:dTDP-4-dehydrorhamnose reductase [Lacinutrix sp. Bg11-31]AUC82956.1 dTDP-4-dehydrorhamnose reductase [Lacinutrix sp. Bg11-31]